MITSTVSLNLQALKRIEAKLQQALEMTADAVMGDLRSRETIPRKVGTLQGEAMHVVSLGTGLVAVTNSTPYARRLYYHPEYDFNQTENRNAGALWFAPYLDGGERNGWLKETFSAMCKKVGL